MAISITRYVDIVSGVGAAADVATRSLIARLFSTNALIPTGSVIELDNADDAATYFGSTSEEYKRALFYFAWISKNITAPKKIGFARWADVAVAPRIFGHVGTQAVASYTGITAGSFTMTLGATTNTMTGLNFSSAASLADVAAVIQAAIRTKTGAMWTAATVTYNATRQSFDFTGGVTGAAAISVVAGTGGSDVAAQLGWLSSDTILSEGAAIQTITEVLGQSADGSNNFGSFTFLAALTQDQVVEAATWNKARNNEFLYSVRCTTSTAAALSTALSGIGGVTLTLAPISTEYPEQIPMMILAATNYEARSATQNFMFQMFNITPSVSTNADANIYDNLKVNYYGQTQTAGNKIAFYQRGFMMGLSTDPRDQNTYANEIWLKDAMAASILTVLLSLAKISANSSGRAQILSIIQGVIDQALFNGTISSGKALDNNDKLFITNATGDDKAWFQVQNIGYWVDVVITKEVVMGITQYKAVYTLIYSKDDVIRKVEGRDILI